MEYKCIIFSVLFFICTVEVIADRPCAVRAISGRSVVCVCNSTYCDEVTRDTPHSGVFVAYTSSKGGSRFNKVVGELKQVESSDCCSTKLVLDVSTRFQTIEGFGGAVTDAAGINWKNLSSALQNYLIESYYGDNGNQYNMVRVPIGGSDFSTHAYAYNELPENDSKLSNYTLTDEDYNYKIPMIKAIQKASSSRINIVATTWSPPIWMKSNHAFYGFSRLKPEYFQTYADYHYKFIEKYAAADIPIWAITTTNEPVNGVIPFARFNSLGWTPESMGKWIVENLGPTIRNSTFRDVKILGVDDQRYTIPLWFNVMAHEHPKALDYLDGVAVHYYGDFITPASFLSDVGKKYPGKFVLSTEACEGSQPWEVSKVDIGQWGRAVKYAVDILEDLNHNVVGWIDWNLCLNANGGPTWAKNFVDSTIIVFPEKDEFYKQPMYYAMGHFSKFLPRGSVRVGVKQSKPFLKSSLDNVAFVTPNKTIVVVIYNSGNERSVAIRVGSKQAELQLEPHSITTVEIPNE